MSFPRPDAEALVGQIYDAMRESLTKVVADLLAEPDPNELSPRQLARVERAAASSCPSPFGILSA